MAIWRISYTGGRGEWTKGVMQHGVTHTHTHTYTTYPIGANVNPVAIPPENANLSAARRIGKEQLVFSVRSKRVRGFDSGVCAIGKPVN